MSALLHRWDELRLAVMLLSRLPVGRIAREVPLAEARWAYPLVGLPIGALAGLCFGGTLALGAAPTLAAVLTLGALALLTGGLHHDGLADFADGLAGRTRARRLEIMRDSRIGTYGVLALVLTLGATGAALADLAGQVGLAHFLAIAVVSRWAMLAVLTLLPAARSDGLGHSAGGSAYGPLLPGALLSLVLVLWAGPVMALCAGACAVAATGVALLAQRRLGGQTGDVLGAVQMTSEAAQWVVLSIALGSGA